MQHSRGLLRDQSGVVSILMILAAEAIIFILIYWLSPLHNQLLKLNKSNKEFEIAHIIGEEFGAQIGQAYYNAFNQYPRPADSKLLCEGADLMSMSIPRRGTLYRMVSEGDSGDYAFLCLPDTGFVIKHPLAPSKLIILGNLSGGKASYNGWLRLVNDPLKMVKKRDSLRGGAWVAQMVLSTFIPRARAADPADFSQTAKGANSIVANSASKLVWEPMAPMLPEGATVVDPLASVVENVDCGPEKSHHCFSFKFCAKVNQDLLPCKDEEFVWQTVALPKLPKTTVETCAGVSL